MSTSYLKTPEQNIDILPFSPSRKRTSTYKSPDYKLNSHNIQSPYNASNLLKTPRRSSGAVGDDGYDSDDTTSQPNKLQKTPQYFSPGKRLFTEDNREDLSEISLQLKSRLSSALGKLQQNRTSVSSSKVIGDLSSVLPRQSWGNNTGRLSWGNGSGGVNVNLQDVFDQAAESDVAGVNITSEADAKLAARAAAANALSNSPHLFAERVNIPSPDEESSAHNALIAALSRQKRKSRTSFSSGSPIRSHRRNSSISGPSGTSSTTSNVSGPPPVFPPSTPRQQIVNTQMNLSKLPLINVAVNEWSQGQSDKNNHSGSNTTNNNSGGAVEQDAVLSLMSLSSPQSVKFSHGHSRNTSLNNIQSPPQGITRASSVASSSSQTVLPPISGLINSANNHGVIDDDKTDNDETDIENDDTDEEVDDK